MRNIFFRYVNRPFLKIIRNGRNVLEQRKIKNNNFSIICNTCIGGIICHDLGMKFNSPTINLYIKPEEFVVFCENIDEYLSAPLEECEYDSRIGYPVARLKDIKVYGKHYKTFDELQNKWEERKKRICWDNLFIIMTDRDIVFPSKERSVCRKEVLARFNALPFENKICFVAKPYKELDSCHVITKGNDGDCVGVITDIVGINGRRMYQYAEDFDYIKWLNREIL